MVKNGTRLQSQVDDTQVIVVKSADSPGRPALWWHRDDRAGRREVPADIDPKFSDGTVMGKRYVDGGAELLSTRRAGHLTVGETAVAQETKPLPIGLTRFVCRIRTRPRPSMSATWCSRRCAGRR